MIDIVPEPVCSLDEYARVPIAFRVERIMEVSGDRRSEFTLTERAVDLPWIKDYDAIPGAAPEEWPRHFDLSNWEMIVARIDGRRVGGALLAFDTDGAEMFEGRSDLAVLWDIRVAPDARRTGVGSVLFEEALHRTRERGCRQLKIETQNINVAACRFYMRMGCRLGAVEPGAYAGLPEEIRMLWYRDLAEVATT